MFLDGHYYVKLGNAQNVTYKRLDTYDRSASY